MLLIAEIAIFVLGLIALFKGRLQLLGRVLTGQQARIAGAILVAPLVIFVPLGGYIGAQMGLKYGPDVWSRAEFIDSIMQLTAFEFLAVLAAIIIVGVLLYNAPKFIAAKKDFFKKILTVEEGAQYLQVSVPELLLLIEDGRIPAGRVEGSYRIAREAIDDYVKQAV